MSPLSVFSSPFLLGFDELEQLFDRIIKAPNNGYPPYNIESFDSQHNKGCGSIRITLAVAGFSITDLDISIEERVLIIRGKQSEDATKDYLHRGIATRQFQRTFVLADGLEIEEAALKNGLLSIVLIQPKPVGAIQKITIRNDNE
jgi:HSP20 family molecular chaperone IbpA